MDRVEMSGALSLAALVAVVLSVSSLACRPGVGLGRCIIGMASFGVLGIAHASAGNLMSAVWSLWWFGVCFVASASIAMERSEVLKKGC